MTPGIIHGVRLFVTSVGLGAVLGAVGCVAPPIEARAPACAQTASASSDPALGVRVEAASEGFEACASCEPRSVCSTRFARGTSRRAAQAGSSSTRASPARRPRSGSYRARVVQSWVLQITAVLHPSPDRRHAPVLRELSLEVRCLDPT